MTRRSWTLAALWVVLVVVYAALSGLWTDTSSEWYRSLQKPAFQPPGVVFSIIWPLNYLALAVVGVLVSRSHPRLSAKALPIFAVSVVLALGWAYLFSQAQLLIPPAVSLVLAAVLTWVVLAITARAHWAYGVGLLVYACWMTLAATISVTIAVLN